MSDLQKIVVLCFLGTLILGGALFVAPIFIPFEHNDAPKLLDQVDPPSVDAQPGQLEPNDFPLVSNGVVIDSFADCVKAGHAVTQSYPAQCRVNGFVFTQKTPEDSSTQPVACTRDAKLCADGSSVGRTGPDCAFAACPGERADLSKAHVCTQEEKQAQICTMEYAPVCGLVQVQCVTTPCDPVPETFSNGCTACGQENVISYTQGECEG